MRKLIWGAFLFGAALVFSLSAQAQEYPSKLIKIVVPTPAGGGLDRMARLLAERFREKWGQPVVVDNRAGAGGNIGAEAVARSEPDGHTILITAPGPLVVNKSLYAKLAYDPDMFVPISVVVTSPNVLLVHPRVPAGTVQELIAYAKANPDKLNYASQGNGSTAHLAAELFKSMAGVKIVHVPYKDNPAAVRSLLSGDVDMIFTDIGNALLQVRADRLRALAVGSEKRSPFLPDIPALSEVLPGFVSIFWTGIVAPPGASSVIANKISTEVADAIKQPDFAKQLLNMNFMAVGGSPAEMALFMKEESERWAKVIRAIGIKSE